MSYEIIIDKDTFNDLEEIIQWHENIRKNLGLELLGEFNILSDLLSTNPQIFKKDYLYFRKALLNRFPYSVFYGIDEDLKQIKIVGIFHTSRNPNESKKRIKSKKE